MKSLIFLLCVLLVMVSNSLSQTNTPATPAQSDPTRDAGNNNGQSRINEEEQRRRNQSGGLNNLEIPRNSQRPLATILKEDIQPLYRKPSKKELKHLLPSQSLLTQYEKFLQQPDTGIFKLSADSNCVAKPNVVVATESCLSNDIPGGGTAYSFRVKSHRMLHLADLVLEKNIIKTDSLLQQGLMVNLGKVELEQISAQTNGLKFLLDFKPATNKEELANIDKILGTGIKSDGFIYTYGLYVEVDSTYALRSIAYQGKIPRSISGYNFNEMDFDKRKDIVVVFRIIEKDSNGDITILWKGLADKESPKLKLEKN